MAASRSSGDGERKPPANATECAIRATVALERIAFELARLRVAVERGIGGSSPSSPLTGGILGEVAELLRSMRGGR